VTCALWFGVYVAGHWSAVRIKSVGKAGPLGQRVTRGDASPSEDVAVGRQREVEHTVLVSTCASIGGDERERARRVAAPWVADCVQSFASPLTKANEKTPLPAEAFDSR
jgi:hypothetical protein